MLGVADMAAVSLARAERQRRRSPPLRRYRTVACLIAVTCACGLVGQTAGARAQSAPTCTAVSAEIDALNARLVARSAAMNAAMAGMMAQQQAQRDAMEAQRRAGVAAGVAGALLGMIVPGAELVGPAVGRATRGTPPVASTAPSADVMAALADTGAQGEDAVRAGALMTQYQQLGCQAAPPR
ncbi:MAG: hypothetical protein PGN23_18085 [Sphingomonas adhaesiva]|uniref:hypothetical protein n=1 Tax=Sphingomonas adhaesiva TaxID=28212 RepID=UPI002FFB0877